MGLFQWPVVRRPRRALRAWPVRRWPCTACWSNPHYPCTDSVMKPKMSSGAKRVPKTVVPKTVFVLGEMVLDPSELFAGLPSNWPPREQKSERRIIADLAKAGVVCETIDDLANHGAPTAAVPVLLRHLDEGHSRMINALIAWSLQTKAIRHCWVDFLSAFKKCRSKLLGEDLAMAIVVGAGKEQVDDVAELCGRKGCHARGLLMNWVKKKRQTRRRKGR